MSIYDQNSIVAKAVRTRKIINVKNVKENEIYLEIDDIVKSELVVPIMIENEVLGVLNVESESESAFTEDDENILMNLAERTATIIKQHELENQLRSIHQLSLLISQSQDYLETFEQMASFASRVLNFKIFGILEVLKSGKINYLVHRGYTMDVTKLKIHRDSQEFFLQNQK